MNVVMDADCLIKLTKARIKEEVCRAFRVFIPGNVCREVLRNAAEHPECGVVLANLQSGALVEVESRKLAGKGTGLETYVARLYRQGGLTLREAASRLSLDLTATMDVLLDHGVKGNLGADDVLTSIRHFTE